MTYRFTVLLERGESENVWVATVPALPGCMTQGATVDEALERAHEAATGHVEALIALGEPIPAETAAAIVTTIDVVVGSLADVSQVGAAD